MIRFGADKRGRRRFIIALSGAVLASVGLYAILCAFWGLAIPCPIYALTGLYCPGCGVTRMLLSLLRLDFALAWRYNPAILLLALPLAALLVDLARGYLSAGVVQPSRWRNTAALSLVIALLVFGVVRNLPGAQLLRPPL